jgi:hypothetical protein
VPYRDDRHFEEEADASRTPQTNSNDAFFRRSEPGSPYPNTQDEGVPADTPTIDRPAHPLPNVRRNAIDYDRYLEPASAKFKIFSAEKRRRQRRTIIIAVLAIIVLVAIIAWAIASGTQG